MQNDARDIIMFGLKSEIASITPDKWQFIKRKAAEQIVANLLEDLDGIPSLNGRLLRESCIDINEKIRRGA